MSLFKSKNYVERSGCTPDKETGVVTCKKTRMFSDGSEQEIGMVRFSMDGQCKPVVDESFEDEEGVIDELERKYARKMITQCKSRPHDY